MSWERRKKLMFRWSLATAGLIAAFWGVTIELPFVLSCLWDVLNGPRWVGICLIFSLGIGLALGLVFGPCIFLNLFFRIRSSDTWRSIVNWLLVR